MRSVGLILCVVCSMFVIVVSGLSASLQAQEMTIVTVKRNNLIGDRGNNYNIRKGDVYHVVRGDEVIGTARVMIVKQSMCGLKVFEWFSQRRPEVGDHLVNVEAFQNEEQSIFNEMEDMNFRDDQPLRDRTIDGPPYQINRKGFIVGGGIGAGYLRNQAGGLAFGTTNRATFLTDFKIGYAPTNALELYYVNKVSWWSESGTTVIVALSSVGFSVYTDKRTATGLYLTGGAGLSTVDAPFESVDASYGFGLFGGIGYEFTEHVSFQTDLLYSHVTDFGVELDSFAVRLMINVLAY